MPLLTVFLGVLLTLGACTGASTPRDAAEGYLQALSDLNFERAAQFVGDEGRRDFEALRQLYSTLSTEERRKFEFGPWKVTAESTNGDTATVDFTFSEVKRGQLSLHRVAGTWLVDHRRTF